MIIVQFSSVAEPARTPAHLTGFLKAYGTDGSRTVFESVAVAVAVIALRHGARANIYFQFHPFHQAVDTRGGAVARDEKEERQYGELLLHYSFSIATKSALYEINDFETTGPTST